MNSLYIQVMTEGEWRNVTTVKVDASPNPSDAAKAYSRAYSAAIRQLHGWMDYFGTPIRIAERTARGGYKVATR